jgi:hypothetical protein
LIECLGIWLGPRTNTGTGVDARYGLVLSWGELASFGMDFWPQEAPMKAIAAVLGADLADAIPELVRLANLEVRIPRLEILSLENASPTATASRSTPSSRASCWMSCPPTRSTWPRRYQASPPRFGGRNRSTTHAKRRSDPSFRVPTILSTPRK